MSSFIVPQDSLSHLYPQACTEFTWEKVRTSIGVKVKPKTRTQNGATCIYEAVAAWLESHLRLYGIIVCLSSEDLREKEQTLKSEESDRTIRCIIVIKNIGVCTEEDYKKKNLYGTLLYKAGGCSVYYKLYHDAIKGALESMHKGPLLVVFHTGENYQDYVFTFKEEPVLSYERYREDVMVPHAVNSLGYGMENVVPSWLYMNSYGKTVSRGIGRVLPQNCMFVYGMDGVKVDRCTHRKRSRPDDEEPSEEEGTSKKTRLEMHEPMELGDDMMEVDL